MSLYSQQHAALRLEAASGISKRKDLIKKKKKLVCGSSSFSFSSSCTFDYILSQTEGTAFCHNTRPHYRSVSSRIQDVKGGTLQTLSREKGQKGSEKKNALHKSG